MGRLGRGAVLQLSRYDSEYYNVVCVSTRSLTRQILMAPSLTEREDTEDTEDGQRTKHHQRHEIEPVELSFTYILCMLHTSIYKWLGCLAGPTAPVFLTEDYYIR
jgi:hypothetical protein